MKIKAICIAVSLLTLNTAQAEQWSGQGEAGLIKASGNTESENYNVGLSFKKAGDKVTQKVGLNVLQASNNDVDSADSLNANYTAEYSLSERSYAFGSLSYLDDDFDGFTEQSSVSFGYGYKVILSDKVAWDLGAGVGYRDTSELIKLADGSEQEGKDLSGATFVIKSDYVNQLTSNTQFIDTFVAEIGSDNTFIENDASLVVAMNEKFSLKAGILMRHNTDPAPGADDTDTISSINLVYNFK